MVSYGSSFFLGGAMYLGGRRRPLIWTAVDPSKPPIFNQSDTKVDGGTPQVDFTFMNVLQLL